MCGTSAGLPATEGAAQPLHIERGIKRELLFCPDLKAVSSVKPTHSPPTAHPQERQEVTDPI